MKQSYKKIGALWRAPIIHHAAKVTGPLAVIGMVTYVDLYNPRASLKTANSPANARGAPASKPGGK